MQILLDNISLILVIIFAILSVIPAIIALFFSDRKALIINKVILHIADLIQNPCVDSTKFEDDLGDLDEYLEIIVSDYDIYESYDLKERTSFVMTNMIKNFAATYLSDSKLASLIAAFPNEAIQQRILSLLVRPNILKGKHSSFIAALSTLLTVLRYSKRIREANRKDATHEK